MIIPDINLMVYAHNSSVPEHPAAMEWWRRILTGPEPVGIAWVVVLGFVRILSNPRIVPHPAQPAVLLEIVSEILGLPAVRMIVPGTSHVGVMKRLFEESGGTGKITTDVHLAAMAIELGAVLASNDADFSRFPGLRWTNPLE